ncbi:MAG: HRDC domain-containing protein [Candidatus Saccharimonadales bacterium]
MTQNEALAILESGRSVLITGAAGTGKTYLLNKFIRRAKQRGQNVAITATTGLAATHLNGTTIHAWAGIGVHDTLEPQQIKKLSQQRQTLINKADVLVIDEISMLHDFRLDMVDQVLRAVRESDEPFGGVQVVMSGDFFQLPPINRRDSRQGSFVTFSQAWDQDLFTVCYLQEQFRQSEDQLYTDILNGIRAGVLRQSQLKALQDRANAIDDPFTTRTRLLTVNVDVDSVNLEHLAELDTSTYEYTMEASGGKKYIEQLKRSCLAPEILQLKKGARVMCVKNSQDRKYVNGSLGVVVDFEEVTKYPTIELNNGRTITVQPETWELMDGDKRRAQISQLPLRLAWAITVHKSQGMTLDAARIDLSRAFVEGMGYVALSRVRGIDHLILDGLNGMALRVSPLARQIDAELRQKSEHALDAHAQLITGWQAAEESGENERKAKAAATLPIDQTVFEALKSWRTKKAAELGKPAYIVAHNSLLEQLAASKPRTEKDLKRIPGIGPQKLETYGKDILQIINKF